MHKYIFILSIFLNILVSNSIYNDSWAIIIGINKYANAQNLDYAVDDAIDVKNLLINKYKFSENNVITLLDEHASYMQIRKAFSNITKQAGDNDRILMFYAGHGQTIDLPEGGEMGYLIPSDGDPEDLFASSIPMDELKRISLMTNAKHILFLVDVCYGGLAAAGTRSLDPLRTPNYLEKITNDKSRQIITAGGKGEKVIEKAEWGHSAFTYNLLRGLGEYRADYNSDGLITAEELGIFLRDKVTIDTENQQTPQSRRMTSHEGEFVFVYDSDKKINNSLTQPTIDYDLLASKIEVVTNDSLAVLIVEKTDQILEEVIIDPLDGKRFGVEFSPLYTMFDAFTPNGGLSFSGSFSNFSLSDIAEITFPFSYHKYYDNGLHGSEEVERVYYYMDAQYRMFLGKHRMGRWIGAGIRFYSDKDDEGSYNKGGISFGIGRRIFSERGLYWGSSLYLGKYYFGEKDRGASSFFKLELLKFGFAF